MSADPWHVYLISTADNKHTYIGATNNPNRRLKQHNGESSGGARSTAGRSWRRIALVSGFNDKIEALQFEWRWKFLTKSSPPGSPIERRLDAVHRLFILFPRADELTYNESL
jgi:predicted GIY-YIG superfamily endonuclease